jgi:hypothetical protein
MTNKSQTSTPIAIRAKFKTRSQRFGVLNFGAWCLFVVCFLSFGILRAQIPASRVTDWSKAGVVGGIPTFSTIVNFLNNGGVSGNTSFDNSVPLQALVNSAAGSSTVIFFPAGTYRFKQKINIPATGRLIFRGAGADSTKFEFETGVINTGNFEVWGGASAPITVNSGYTKGSTQLVLANVSGLAVNDWIDISQENDSLLMWTNNPSNSLTEGPRGVGQILKITAISGNTITVDRPLRYTYKASLNVEVYECNMAKRIGFENFTIESVTAGEKHHFLFVYAVNCWIKCVRSIKSDVTHVNPSFCANLTIRDSYFHDSYQFGNGGHGGGVCISMHSTDLLVENNVFDKLRHAMLVQRGANGNVFGYNYSINATSSGTVSAFTRLPDGSLHGHFPYMNLYEGNVMQEIHSADNWGPSGYANTFFRNRVCREGIRISDRSLEQNIVGNDLRKDGTAQFTQNVIINESGVVNTLIHGNKESGTVSWDAALGSNNLINSYYLTAAPAFFNGGLWPSLGPEAACTTGTIPAEVRFGLGKEVECTVSVTTGLNENTGLANVQVYPNPSSEWVAVEFQAEGTEPVKIKFINTLGQELFPPVRETRTAGTVKAVLDISKCPAGIYSLVLFSEDKSLSTQHVAVIR